MPNNSYPPIGDYAFIADCHSVALVSRAGSIDWCCMPRIDSGSIFGRMLDWEHGGYCSITPVDPFEVRRRYIEDTLVLETEFSTRDAGLRITDCFTMHEAGEHRPHQQILRTIEGLQGRLACNLAIVPRFDYGAIKPWIRTYNGRNHIALGGCDGLLISGYFAGVHGPPA